VNKIPKVHRQAIDCRAPRMSANWVVRWQLELS